MYLLDYDSNFQCSITDYQVPFFLYLVNDYSYVIACYCMVIVISIFILGLCSILFVRLRKTYSI